MGRRRARARPPPPRKPILPKVFNCLFCSGHNTVEVNEDRAAGASRLKCRLCGAFWNSQSNYLWQPTDAYHEWLDATVEANYAPHGSYQSLEDGGLPPAGAANQRSGDVNAMLERDEQQPNVRSTASSSRQRERSCSTKSWSSSSSQSEDELQDESHGVAASSPRSARAASVVGDQLQERRDGVSEQDEHGSVERHTIVEASVSEELLAVEMAWQAVQSADFESTAGAETMRAPPVSVVGNDDQLQRLTLESGLKRTLPHRNWKLGKKGKQVNLWRRRSARIANRMVQVPRAAQQTRKQTLGRRARVQAAAAQPVVVQPSDDKVEEASRPDEKFAVQRLVRPIIYEGEVSYLVYWKGYEEPTVEPRCSLMRDIPDVVKAFERAHNVQWRKNKANRNCYTWKRTVSKRSQRMSANMKTSRREPREAPHVHEAKDTSKRAKKGEPSQPKELRRQSPRTRIATKLIIPAAVAEPRRRSPRTHKAPKISIPAAVEETRPRSPRPRIGPKLIIPAAVEEPRPRSPRPRIRPEQVAPAAVGEPRQAERERVVESKTDASAKSSTDEDLFVVQRLVRPTVFEGEISYVVLWKGYKEPTVEPRCNLVRDAPWLVENFERDHRVQWRDNPCRFTWSRAVSRKAR